MPISTNFSELPMVWSVINNVLSVVPDITSPEVKNQLYPQEGYYLSFEKTMTHKL